MFKSSPPRRSKRKTLVSSSPQVGDGLFSTPKGKPKEIYYEDLYGERNKDEEAEGEPDACESEPSSGDEESEQFTKSAEYKRLFAGNYGGYAGASVRGKSIASRFCCGPANSFSPGSKSTPRTSITVDQRKTSRSEKRFRISPKENPRRSVELSSSESDGIFEKEVSSEVGREEQGELDTPPPAAVGPRRSRRVPRPVSRRLFKQQLAAQDKEKRKESAMRAKEEKQEKKERAAVRLAAKSKRINKKAKLMEDLGDDEDGLEAVKGYVLVDLTGVDVKEYERWSD